MKKLFIVLISFVCVVQLTTAQRSMYSEKPDGLYTQGKEMYLNKNYLGAIHSLQEFGKLSNDQQLLQEAKFMIVSSQYYRGEAQASQLLKDYLSDYPSTLHRSGARILRKKNGIWRSIGLIKPTETIWIRLTKKILFTDQHLPICKRKKWTEPELTSRC